ncbi:MAG: hypothetical protein HY292_09890 [Planctomycetes bacterium]|nr:hypothetical protein [Planctomycetota bacterium]
MADSSDLGVGSEARSQTTRSWIAFCVALVALFLARGLVVLCLLPPFDAWDEYQHLAYIQHVVEQGTPPRLNVSRVSPDLVAAIVRFPQSTAALHALREHGAVSYAEFWRAGGAPVARASRPMPLLYEAQHTPFYYRLVRPLFEVAGGIRSLPASLAVLRATNLGLAAGALLAILLFLPTIVPSAVQASLIALAIASQPLFLVNACRVANDALAVLFATFAVIAGLRLDARRSLAQPLALGLFVGLAIMAKTLNLVLLPFGVVAVALACWRTCSRTALIGALVSFLLGVAVVAGPYFFENLRETGSVLPLIQDSAIGVPGRSVPTVGEAATSIDWLDWLHRLWGRGTLWDCGWSSIQAHWSFKKLHVVFLVVGLLGCALACVLRTRRAWNPLSSGRVIALSLILCVCYTAGLAQQAVLNFRAYGRCETAPWYAAAAFPWLICCLSAGFVFLAGPRWGRRVTMVLVVIYVFAEVEGLFVELPKIVAGESLGSDALARIGSLQPQILRTPTLAMAIVAWFGLLLLCTWTCVTRRFFSFGRAGRHA